MDDIDDNKEASQKQKEVLNGIKKEIRTINSGKKIEYGKDDAKIFKKLGSNLMKICQWISL